MHDGEPFLLYASPNYVISLLRREGLGYSLLRASDGSTLFEVPNHSPSEDRAHGEHWFFKKLCLS
jgi:hypothetical protein